jgi:1,4-alpha-glucan branching enzyme
MHLLKMEFTSLFSGFPVVRPLHLALLIVAVTMPSYVSAQVVKQSNDLVPQKADNGVLFQCLVPKATSVYLAGDFNNWANNDQGTISDPAFKMTGPDAKGLWRMVVKLDPGDHKFKFSVNGVADQWFTPEWATEHDSNGNGVIHVTDYGEPLLRSQVNADWQPQQKDGKVTFRFYSPSAQSIYIAGDFNKWADSNKGQVSDARYLMTKSDDGVWKVDVSISPGHHLYQFVIDGSKWELDPNGAGKDDQNHSVIDVK